MKAPTTLPYHIEWLDGALRFVDQTKLPREVAHIETGDYRVIADSIRSLAIRGAPAIGVAAAYGVVLAAQSSGPGRAQAGACRTAIEVLAGTRPTAVNLFAALSRMEKSLSRGVSAGDSDLAPGLEAEALSIHEEDRVACDRIASFGASLITGVSSVLTHCHTGALATGGGGTALNVILEAHRMGNIARVYVDETRPLLQGARLTAWELLSNGAEAVLITDNTAGYLMKMGKVDSVWVGADRIAANGDTANKIGTYGLAVLAGSHMIPFYVAAPLSTVDFSKATGEEIPIEERDGSEVTSFAGIRIAPEGVEVFAPAFDVTPASFITAIVTDRGVVRPPYTASLKEVSGLSGLRRSG